MKDKDIYFTEEYCRIYELNGDGKLETFRFQGEEGRVEYNFLKREIPIKCGEEIYFDISTPYGYGGPLFSDYSDDEGLELLKKNFEKSFSEYCSREGIVSEFIRFHPLVKNHEFLKGIVDVSYNRHTVCLETENEKKILENLTSTCRNRIKKSFQADFTIKIERDIENFYNLYIETMDKNSAQNYYYFSREFFQNTMDLLGEGAKIFSAYLGDEPVSSILIIHRDQYMHYHFVGSSYKYRDLSANNRLIFEAAKWGSENGKRYFHLGGGHLGDEDSIYHFKSTFTKGEPREFYIGKKIHNEKIYNQLVELRNMEGTIENPGYFPLYRAD